MNILKSFAAVAGAVFLSISPVAAENSYELLQAVNRTGVDVRINSNECNGNFLGMFRHNSNLTAGQMVLCPGRVVDNIDHLTVKHEAMHLIQACVNYSRGTTYETPVMSLDTLVEMVNQHVPAEEVTFIKANYDRSDWLVEFEAHLAEHEYSYDFLINMLNEACFQ